MLVLVYVLVLLVLGICARSSILDGYRSRAMVFLCVLGVRRVCLLTFPQWEAAIAQAVGSIDLAMDYSFVLPSDTINPVRGRNGRYSANAAVDSFTYSYD